MSALLAQSTFFSGPLGYAAIGALLLLLLVFFIIILKYGLLYI